MHPFLEPTITATATDLFTGGAARQQQAGCHQQAECSRSAAHTGRMRRGRCTFESSRQTTGRTRAACRSRPWCQPLCAHGGCACVRRKRAKWCEHCAQPGSHRVSHTVVCCCHGHGPPRQAHVRGYMEPRRGRARSHRTQHGGAHRCTPWPFEPCFNAGPGTGSCQHCGCTAVSGPPTPNRTVHTNAAASDVQAAEDASVRWHSSSKVGRTRAKRHLHELDRVPDRVGQDVDVRVEVDELFAVVVVVVVVVGSGGAMTETAVSAIFAAAAGRFTRACGALNRAGAPPPRNPERAVRHIVCGADGEGVVCWHRHRPGPWTSMVFSATNSDRASPFGRVQYTQWWSAGVCTVAAEAEPLSRA